MTVQTKRAMVWGTAIACILLACGSSSAKEATEINFFCKNECLERGGTIGRCNALCSVKNESGEATKDTDCLSTCMGKVNQTAYSCYSMCDSVGNALENKPEKSIMISPHRGRVNPY